MDLAVENFVFDAVMLYLVMQVCTMNVGVCLLMLMRMLNMQSSSIRSAGLLAAPLRNDELSAMSFRRQLPRAGSGVVRIDPLHFLAGCRKRRLNQALSVLSLSLGFLCMCCAVN